ncbi:MAG: hypothetical protein HXY43_01015 [Fischerella sp.]|uniref:SdrD B-like domain-containing protein n=1 Tax=Fischerella sp. TaxID=1191 RepID=UPI0017FAF8DA|nr:SdrD B-like domain-containing protein [Fischerella sp.]NWF57923.1 hypothetical protein [Fischerella sp.]
MKNFIQRKHKHPRKLHTIQQTVSQSQERTHHQDKWWKSEVGLLAQTVSKEFIMKNFLRLNWRHLSRASLLVPLLLLSPFFTNNARAVSIQMNGTRTVLSGTDCGIATYRFSTNTTFNGKQLDLLVEVLSEDNEYQGGQCIDASSNVLSVRLRDNDAGDNVAYMELKITVVEKNTTTPVEVDRLTITGFDLDINPGGGTDTDDIYLKLPDGVYTSSNSEVQYSEGSFFSGQYQAKLKGTSTRNCDDGATTTDVSCRGGAIYINGSNGVNKVSSVTVRLQNDNAYGQASGTSSHRLLQLSFEISKFDEIVTNNSDYGDTPNSYGSTGHSVGSNIVLGYGLVPDHETAHQASTNADSDDNDGASSIKYDDEDGVKYNSQALNGQTLPAGNTSNLDITTFGTGYLSGWIDLNRDGDFNDVGEKVISDRNITSNTVSTTSVPITIPASASGGTSYMRFRFTTTTGVAASGYSNSDGEVEDYQITIAPTTTTISGTLYEDTDGGDDFDNGETTLPANITVKLLDTNNNVVATTTTAANGTYTFTNVTNGNYKIQVDTSDTDIPAGYTLGTSNNLAVTVSGSLVTGQNFGFDPPAPTYSISGTLYEDTDGGNDFDSGESTLPANITIKLLDSNNNVVATTTTAANGIYIFTNVTNGNYKIQVDTSDADIPPGYTLGTPNNLAVTVSNNSVNNQNFGFDKPVASNPDLLLVKRITAINGTSFTNLIDGVNDTNSPNYVPAPHDTDDNNANWPSNYLQGLLNGGTVRPNDQIEYTIYFLSAGDATAPKVLMCDRVPNNVTFLPTAFNSFATKNNAGLQNADRGIIWQYNGNTESLTNTKDGDVAQYFPPGEDPTIFYPNVDCGGANINGAVVVNLGDLPNATVSGTPTNSYGFIRFRGRVK